VANEDRPPKVSNQSTVSVEKGPQFPLLTVKTIKSRFDITDNILLSNFRGKLNLKTTFLIKKSKNSDLASLDHEKKSGFRKFRATVGGNLQEITSSATHFGQIPVSKSSNSTKPRIPVYSGRQKHKGTSTQATEEAGAPLNRWTIHRVGSLFVSGIHPVSSWNEAFPGSFEENETHAKASPCPTPAAHDPHKYLKKSFTPSVRQKTPFPSQMLPLLREITGRDRFRVKLNQSLSSPKVVPAAANSFQAITLTTEFIHGLTLKHHVKVQGLAVKNK
jgi:hypothetical protein